MERALKNTVLAKDYGLSLKSLFKDKYKYWDDSYAIPFSEFRHCKKYLFEYIKSSCNGDTVCGKLKTCYGHQFTNLSKQFMNFNVLLSSKKEFFTSIFLFLILNLLPMQK